MSDIADFFDPDICVTVTRTRPGADDVTLQAIAGLEDVDALEDRVIAARRRLLYATGPDLIDGDIVTVVGAGALALYSGRYRVVEPRQRNDGLESECLITRTATQP